MTTSHTPSRPHAPGFWSTAFIYGGLAGFLVISWMLINYYLFGFHSDPVSQTVGFLTIFFILSLIFFGMKRFRDKVQGGVIKFSKALMLGIAMSLFAGLAYVIISEIFLAINDGKFIAEYTDHLIAMQKAKNISPEALTEFTEKMATMESNYANPLYRIPLTFAEIFPMGFIVSLVSALFLHTPKFWSRKR